MTVSPTNEPVASRFYLLAAVPFLLALPDGWVFNNWFMIGISGFAAAVNLLARVFFSGIDPFVGKLLWILNTGSSIGITIIYFSNGNFWTGVIWLIVSVLFGILTVLAFMKAGGGTTNNAGTN